MVSRRNAQATRSAPGPVRHTGDSGGEGHQRKTSSAPAGVAQAHAWAGGNRYRSQGPDASGNTIGQRFHGRGVRAAGSLWCDGQARAGPAIREPGVLRTGGAIPCRPMPPPNTPAAILTRAVATRPPREYHHHLLTSAAAPVVVTESPSSRPLKTTPASSARQAGKLAAMAWFRSISRP